MLICVIFTHLGEISIVGYSVRDVLNAKITKNVWTKSIDSLKWPTQFIV